MTEFFALRPAGGFGLIMADPPWSYDMRSEKGYGKAPEAHYKTMPTHEIAKMPVEVLASENAVLWLWAVSPKLPDALLVMESWGFQFKTGGHWAKLTRTGKQSFGPGYILRNAGEPYLIGTRGHPKTTKAVRSVIMGQVREHSRKPEEGYLAAEKLMPHVQRLDLFSRQRRPGWANWGNEANKFGSVA